jgi:glycyl-tRNA synthetase beta chain
LRRAALGVIRLIIEKQLNLDLKTVLTEAISSFGDKLKNSETLSQLLLFIQDRLRTWYLDQGILPDVFASVSVLGLTNLFDMDNRIHAVQAFKKLKEADMLSAANKRVSNILAKCVTQPKANQIDPHAFEHSAEQALAQQLAITSEAVFNLYQQAQYNEVLKKLTELQQPIDNFFEHVMVMTDDIARRDNRILMLKQIRCLFLQVADIALLQ